MSRWVNRHGIIACSILTLSLCQGAVAAPLDCDSAVGDDRYMAEQCTSQELEQAISAHANTSQALTPLLSAEDARQLQALEQAHGEYHQQYCNLLVSLAAADNPAWALTWQDIALDACRADMLTQYQARLDALLDIANRKNSQRAGFRDQP